MSDLRLSQDDIESTILPSLVPIPEEQPEQPESSDSCSGSESGSESGGDTDVDTQSESGSEDGSSAQAPAPAPIPPPKRWDTPEIHSEVEDILCSAEDRRMLFELFASDPRYYIELINNYKKTKDGSDIFLPDLLNIKTSRTKSGKFIIKFKFNDDDRWEEVGYDSNSYSDDDTYKAFSEKVKILLMRPKSHGQREHLKTELTSGNGASTSTVVDTKKQSQQQSQEKQPSRELPIPPSQGKQSKISKIDRFREAVSGLPRYVDDTKPQASPFMSASMAAHMRPSQPQKSKVQLSIHEPNPELIKKRIVRKQEPIESDCDGEEYITDDDESSSVTESDNEISVSTNTLGSIIDGYKRNMLKQMSQIVPAILSSSKQPSTNSKLLKELWGLRKKCPAVHKSTYDHMLKQLQHVNVDPFVSKVLSTIPHATVAELPYLYNFAANANVVSGRLTHEQLCNALQLDEDDRELLREYNINLVKLWESRQQ